MIEGQMHFCFALVVGLLVAQSAHGFALGVATAPSAQSMACWSVPYSAQHLGRSSYVLRPRALRGRLTPLAQVHVTPV